MRSFDFSRDSLDTLYPREHLYSAPFVTTIEATKTAAESTVFGSAASQLFWDLAENPAAELVWRVKPEWDENPIVFPDRRGRRLTRRQLEELAQASANKPVTIASLLPNDGQDWRVDYARDEAFVAAEGTDDWRILKLYQRYGFARSRAATQ